MASVNAWYSPLNETRKSMIIIVNGDHIFILGIRLDDLKDFPNRFELSLASLEGTHFLIYLQIKSKNEFEGSNFMLALLPPSTQDKRLSSN